MMGMTSEAEGSPPMARNGDGPNAARNMGFPNMKYLDPDAKGAPIQERTLYKEYKENNDGIKL